MSSRIVPNILDPLTSSALNKLHEPTPPTLKRKRSDDDEINNFAGQLATPSIVIRAHAASLSDQPLILEPITTLPRFRLPLSWLDDTPSSRSDDEPGGLFTADIPTLEVDLGAKAIPTVLAVRLLANGTLYIVERVKRGMYSLSKLARWVHEGDIVVAGKGWAEIEGMDTDMDVKKEVVRHGIVDESTVLPDGFDWWQAAQIDDPICSIDMNVGPGYKPALDIALVFGSTEANVGVSGGSFVGVFEHRSHSLAPSRSFDAADGDPFVTESNGVADGGEAMDVDGVESHVVDMQQSPEELLDGMRDHYLQALYVSKTSVAYFAKGPLTRCRNAFQARVTEQSHGSAELVEFYREAILAAKKMDLKYREAVPSAVRDAVLADSDDGAKSKKRKSKKKKKLGKNGLYPEEEGFIHRWWKERLTNESSALESREAESKKQISDLRLRETQLQILLILEVMVLEMGIASAEKNNADKEKEPEGEKQTPKKSKAKKSQDLNVLLELHLDRMCIWHAVSMEDTSAADTAKASSFSTSHMSGKKVESDAVRDFCTEVIIPFYAARVPDKCKLITRKFGVSGGISPVSKKTQSSKAHRVEPGAEVKRQQPAQKPRRTLQRVLTDEKAAASHVRHPGLSRSNTAPSQHNMKRDIAEPLLPTVLSGSVRGGIHKAKRTENREVDLNAVARQHETKLRKVQMLVDQKKELDAAIHALRKPNRELVSKDIADDAVKRVTTSGGSSRKSRNPVRNPFGEGVQVMATPRGNRRKEMVGLPPLPRSLAPSRSFAGVENSPLGESPLMVPSSSRRAISFSGADSDPFNPHDGLNGRGPRSSQPDGAVHETPTRPSSTIFQSKSGLGDSITACRPSSSSGKGLFRVPHLPAPRSINESMVPGTPVHSRHKTISTSTETMSSSQQLSWSLTNARSSAIMETPPKKRALQETPTTPSILFPKSPDAMVVDPPRAHSPPAVMGTPVKGPAAVPVTPDKSQSKSIYEQLGWDDEMDF
ncbi:uncharacterized protein N7511_004717 [Penicillium nucicola]|uniref:uncharacterized protein n=1 Tax=Penicillium nucicola TaxID=1850975 RepID=UPI002544ED88|nr:uncharacterized protein N7511_004717 [Penicillium nucicola]KAJ5767101.1 hypothetical protein N7511_004717 [Penicillium nucicola]